MNKPLLSIKTRRAIAAYGAQACERAYEMNLRGEGASTIAFTGPATIKTTRQADAAINAGCELAEVTVRLNRAKHAKRIAVVGNRPYFDRECNADEAMRTGFFLSDDCAYCLDAPTRSPKGGLRQLGDCGTLIGMTRPR